MNMRASGRLTARLWPAAGRRRYAPLRGGTRASKRRRWASPTGDRCRVDRRGCAGRLGRRPRPWLIRRRACGRCGRRVRATERRWFGRCIGGPGTRFAAVVVRVPQPHHDDRAHNDRLGHCISFDHDHVDLNDDDQPSDDLNDDDQPDHDHNDDVDTPAGVCWQRERPRRLDRAAADPSASGGTADCLGR